MTSKCAARQQAAASTSAAAQLQHNWSTAPFGRGAKEEDMGRLVRTVLAFVCTAVLLPSWAAAQEGATVSGRVTSEAGAPLGSASVFLEGMNIGTLTGDDGTYRFTVPAARATGQTVTMTARLIGFRAQSVQVALRGGQITQNFTLAANPLRLGEVVVTGAGTTSTTEKLGNVVNKVDSSLIRRSNEPNVVQALAGKAPNIVVNQQSGDPGAGSSIQIRGLKTITGTGQPLFVIDGVPINNNTIATTDPTGIVEAGGGGNAPNNPAAPI